MELDGHISGKTQIISLIGNPIEHTISPQIHNTISRQLGLDLTYIPFKVEKHNLYDAVNGLKALGVIGFNVTIPYKSDVIEFLDEVSKDALLIGAVNTVKNTDGKLYGHNTDAEGFYRSFREETGTSFKGKLVVVLGAGGAARAIAVKIAMEGAAKVYIANRTAERAKNIADIINRNISDTAEQCELIGNPFRDIFHGSEIIVNTIPLGMYPDVDCMPVDEAIGFMPGQVVFDAVYNPPKTKFLRIAEQSGCKIVNGFGMLLYQGISAYEIWTGVKIPDKLAAELYTLMQSKVLRNSTK